MFQKRPIHIAAEEGDHMTVELLIQRGSNINCHVSNQSSGDTPMKIALDKKHS